LSAATAGNENRGFCAVVALNGLSGYVLVDKMWPCIGTFDQTRPYRILPDILSFLFEPFVSSNSVIKIVFLPQYSGASGGQALSVADGGRHINFSGESGDHVKMIGHKQKNVQDPFPRGVIKYSVVQQRRRR
jgi:hypothetical protein